MNQLRIRKGKVYFYYNTVHQVKEAIVKISRLAQEGDNELAHVLESSLHRGVLRSISEGKCKNPEEVARAALSSEQIQYKRYFG